MFSTLNIHGNEFITCQDFALINGEWIDIQELIELDNDLLWYLDNYDEYTRENPDPRYWGLSL